jgi:hypothetical protein
MQIELKNLQRRLGITFVFVTHDQGEALSMADRVAVFNRGRIEQLDTPRALYARPATAFVARFVGSANVVTGELAQRLSGRAEPFAVRAENMRCARRRRCRRRHDELLGDVADVQYHGAMSRWQVRLESGEVFAAALPDVGSNGDFKSRSRVRLEWSHADAVPLTAAETAVRALSTFLYRRPHLYILLLLIPPLLWFGTVYLGSCSRCSRRACTRSTSSLRRSCTRRRSRLQAARHAAGQRRHHPAYSIDGGCGDDRMRLIALPIANYMVRYASPRGRAFSMSA